MKSTSWKSWNIGICRGDVHLHELIEIHGDFPLLTISAVHNDRNIISSLGISAALYHGFLDIQTLNTFAFYVYAGQSYNIWRISTAPELLATMGVEAIST